MKKGTKVEMKLKTRISEVKWYQQTQTLLLIILGSITLSLAPSGLANSLKSGGRQQIQNVSCISHDAKFTCECKNINQSLQLPHLSGSVYQVEISNCKSLSIDANALEDMQGLRKILFKNIDNLKLEKFALAFSRYASSTPLIIEFEMVNFEIIDSHAISGNIEEISFIGGQLEVINPFGFTTLKESAVMLRMDGVLVKRIESQAFKKFAVEQMEITNCVFETSVPSKAFYELEVLKTLRIYNVKFKEVHSRAFSFKMVAEVSIINNYFEIVNSEWLEAHVRESIIMKENFFGTTSQIAFKGISVHRDFISSERLELRFINNTVRFPLEPYPLEFNEHFALNIKKLQYDNEYACKDLDTSQKPPQPRTAFFASNIDNIYFRSTATVNGNEKNYNQNFVTLNKIINGDCQPRSYLPYILSGVLALVLLLILIAVVLWFHVTRRRKRRKMDVVLPEPRTYKETQIVYQIENAGLLKTDL